ncbi:MAG: exopolysaccharide biosynthesis polyprenyl glycosylphosphotransferase [Patescibacteria group bacterium]|nr:exopolysaccharide biosynthesis polyprenyl glycosylphosphotransferase [Patescibacteria group bacterium]
MEPYFKTKQILLFIGDIVIFYLSLILTLWLRYTSQFYGQLFDHHLVPFSLILIIWLIVFYIAGLYDPRSLKNDIEFTKKFWYSLFFNAIFSVSFFYLNTGVSVAPKTNLFIFLIVFGLLGYLYRRVANTVLAKSEAGTRILLVGTNTTTQEISDYLKNNTQLGYEIKFWMKDGLKDKEFEHLFEIIIANNINTIVLPAHIKKDFKSASLIYKTLLAGIDVMDLAELYELIFKKVPLAELEEVWFLENITQKHRTYEFLITPFEYLAAFLMLIILSPLLLIIAIAVKLTSAGPAIFKQKRVGKNGIEFTIYKFRTMKIDAEKNGPQWANYFNDDRATSIGHFLRATHLDELPQLFNILRGDLSFIGPRPERPEFVVSLKKEIPYYELRHLTKPGITGWAQINFRYGASVKEAYEKTQFDIYYIKNNSPFLDFSILLRTIKFLFTNN